MGYRVGTVAQLVQGLATGWAVRASNPYRGEISRNCPESPWGILSLLYNMYRIFPGGKERSGRDADLSTLLVPWSKKSRTMPLLPLWALWPVQSLSACTTVYFYCLQKLTLQCYVLDYVLLTQHKKVSDHLFVCDIRTVLQTNDRNLNFG